MKNESELDAGEGTNNCSSRWTIVPHQSTSMTGVEDPAETFGEIVRRIDYTGDVAKGDVAIGFPILDSEVLDRSKDQMQIDPKIAVQMVGLESVDFCTFFSCRRGP